MKAIVKDGYSRFYFQETRQRPLIRDGEVVEVDKIDTRYMNDETRRRVKGRLAGAYIPERFLRIIND